MEIELEDMFISLKTFYTLLSQIPIKDPYDLRVTNSCKIKIKCIITYLIYAYLRRWVGKYKSIQYSVNVGTNYIK